MITNDAQLHHVFEQIERMHRVLADLRSDVRPKDPKMYALMVEGPLEEMRRLQAEVDDYAGISIAEDHEVDLWVRIRGVGISWPEAPTSVFSEIIDALRKGIQAVAEHIATGRLTTRPTSEIKEACDLNLIALRPGSLRVGMRLPIEVQPKLGEDRSLVQRSVSEYLQVAAWSASLEDEGALERIIDNPLKRRIVLNALKAIVPRPRGRIDELEISGKSVPFGRPILLLRETRKKINNAIDRTTAEKIETAVGDLREIDLDAMTFILRNVDTSNEIRCSFEEDLRVLAKKALDRRVIVTGSRKIEEGRVPYVKMRVMRLEILDDHEQNPTDGSSE